LNALHYLCKWLLTHLNQRVEVVSHPTEGMNASLILFQCFSHNFIEPNAVIRRAEQVLAMITAQYT